MLCSHGEGPVSLPRVASLSLLLAAAVASSACAQLARLRAHRAPRPTPAASPDDDSRAPPPVMPLALARDDDYVVRIVAGTVTCSGTLVDEDRVLTAHHCVSARNKFGDVLDKDADPSSVRVELGGDYLPWGEVGVKAIVAPPCGFEGGRGDIAVLVLERRLIGVATLQPRLDAPPHMDEAVEPVGFGRCALSNDGIRRKERTGGHVDRIYRSRFQLEASICPGDSGGPALSRDKGQVIGVISESVMDGDAHTLGRSEFTRLDQWRPVFANAKSISDGMNPAELPPVAGCSSP